MKLEYLKSILQASSRTVIRYWPVADRWLIDREGVQAGPRMGQLGQLGQQVV